MTQGTTVHCPDCGAAVQTTADATAVACPACRTAFSPWGLPTAAGPRVSAIPTKRTTEPVAVAAAAAEDLTGRVLDGRRLVRVIGRGGMGTVYEAEDRARGRVAVKVLPLAFSNDRAFVERFRREAKVLASLSHPHLVEVLDRGEDDGRCFFVMEFVRGEGLRRLMDRGPMPWRDALRVAREVLTGLGYAHGRGVVHRDLKPENVLLDDAGRARIVDFGLSRIVRGEAAEAISRLTRTDVILGTYEYMAPEQRLGAPNVDDRADLYAVGVILYEMLTGQLPLGRFPPASELRPGTPAALDEVIHRALATAPTDRYPSAVAFREAIERAELLASAPDAPRPPVASPAATTSLASAAPARSEEARIADARRVLSHVDVLAAADRVIGVVLILFFFGGVTLSRANVAGGAPWFLPWFLPFAGVSSIVYLVGGYLFLKQGKRLAGLEPGAREGQVTASIFQLILFPPIGTALGIYGLVTMTRRPAHEAFALGRSRLLGPLPPLPARMPYPTPAAEDVRWHGQRPALATADAPAAAPARRRRRDGSPLPFIVGAALLTWIALDLGGPVHAGVAIFAAFALIVGAFHWLGFGPAALFLLIVIAALFVFAGRSVREADGATMRSHDQRPRRAVRDFLRGEREPPPMPVLPRGR